MTEHEYDAASLEAALELCARHPDARVLRRVGSLADLVCAAPSPGPQRTVALVDVETTGTDITNDQIIDLAAVVLEVDPLGQITRILSASQALRDPLMPIPPGIVALTGITDADVAGRSLNLAAIEQRLSAVDVRIAHNARFDLSMLSRLVPVLAELPWACSANDLDWRALGFDGRALGHLLMQAGWFSSAHRAMADVIALIHLLDHRIEDGRTLMGVLLDEAAKPSLRIEATGADFSLRHQLKSRGYRWDSVARVWSTEIAEDGLEDETLWLNRIGVMATPRTRVVTWCERHR